MNAIICGRARTGAFADNMAVHRLFLAVAASLVLGLAPSAKADQSAEEGDFSDQLLRLAQCEAILDEPLDGQTGICMDGALGAHWRMPDFTGPATNVPANIRFPVSQARDNCLAASQSADLRVVEPLRAALGNQRRVALANERLAQARLCLHEQAGEAGAPKRRDCLKEASGERLSASQWKRWNVLFLLGQARQ